MTCPKCNGEVWDNRQKKLAGEMKPNAPDFSCKDKAVCKWVQWPPKKGASVAAAPQLAPLPTVAPQPAPNGSRDAQLVELYWRCFDEVLQGLKTRSMASGFPGSEIAACVATMFIARSKIL